MRRPAWFVALVASALVSAAAGAQENATIKSWWPQFRGPGGAGVAPDAKPLPKEIGPDKNLQWKVGLPAGHSSPCVWDQRIFLTSVKKKEKKLETLCLDRLKPKILWRKAVPVENLEHTHQIANPATPTPCTDGERVYVYFGSYGLVCYDFQGELQWEHPLPMPKTRFGTGASPVLVGELVIVSCDFLPKPYLLAVDRKTGKEVWKKERLPMPMEGYATPAIWKHDGKTELVLHTSTRIVAFSPEDGKELWWVGIKSTAGSTAVSGGGKLFVSTWTHGGEAEDVAKLPSFAEMLKKYDKDGDGKLSKAEFPNDLLILKRKEVNNVPDAEIKLIWYFDALDKNKDGMIDASEWEYILSLGYGPTDHGVLAIKPGGAGDIGKTHIAWKEKKSIPEICSPLYFDGLLYLVREGGLVTCLDAETGKVYYKERLGAEGAYFASPVGGDGKIYACSYAGVVSVFVAGKKFERLSQSDFGEHIMATPALVDGHVYLRTEKGLYAFGK